jgi:hypothetical protein
MQFLLLSKVPVNETLQVPQQGPMERAARLQGLLLHISQIPYKMPLNKKKKLSLLSKALGKECPSIFPKSGAPVETDVHFQSFT